MELSKTSTSTSRKWGTAGRSRCHGHMHVTARDIRVSAGTDGTKVGRAEIQDEIGAGMTLAVAHASGRICLHRSSTDSHLALSLIATASGSWLLLCLQILYILHLEDEAQDCLILPSVSHLCAAESTFYYVNNRQSISHNVLAITKATYI